MPATCEAVPCRELVTSSAACRPLNGVCFLVEKHAQGKGIALFAGEEVVLVGQFHRDAPRTAPQGGPHPLRLDEIRFLNRQPLALLQAQFGCAQTLEPLDVHHVPARLQAELHKAPRRLEQLGDQLLVGVADEEAAMQSLPQHHTRRGLAHVGHDHVPGTGQVDVVGRMLRPALRSRGPCQRLAESELVGLAEGDPAVAVDVGGAAQSGHQVVGEEGAVDAIRFLGRFVLRAGGDEGVPLHVHGIVYQERLVAPPSLEPGDGARCAGVQYRDMDVGGDRLHFAAQLLVGEALVSQQQPLLVRVAGVVQHHLRPSLLSGAVHPFPHLPQRPVQLVAAGLPQQGAVSRFHSSHFLQHLREVLPVRHRVAQGHAIAAAVVGACDNDEPPQGARGRGRGQGSIGGAQRPRQIQNGSSLIQCPVLC